MADPKHLGEVPNASAVGVVGNPACGDLLSLFVELENETVRDAKFTSMGSPFQYATADVLCDCVIGTTVESALRRGPGCVLEKLPDLPRNKRYLAQLAIDAFRAAIQQAGSKEAPPGPALQPLSGQEAMKYVLDLLADGRDWSAKEVDANARADGFQLEPSAVRLLVALRKQGDVVGFLRNDSGQWRWWLNQLSSTS